MSIGPICVVHELTIKPGRLAEARRLMTKDYPEHLAPYGVKLKLAIASPVEPPGQPTDLLVVMEYESVDMFWIERGAGMKSTSAAALWSQIDQLVERRERRLLTVNPVSWPPPTPGTSFPRLPRDVHRTTLILKPVARLDASQQAAWLSSIAKFAEANGDVLANSAGFHILQGSSSLPDHLSWDIVTRNAPDTVRFLTVLPGAAIVVHALRLGETVSMSAATPLQSGFKRVVLNRALAGEEGNVDALMEVVGRSTDIIRNWSLTRIDPASDPAGWTHAFEMEFESLSDLAGPYRSSPYHWALADAPFHQEAPHKAGTGFLNCIYPISRSYLCEL